MIQVMVQNYRTRRAMEKDLEVRVNDGWKIETQSGSFKANPLGRLFPMLSPKITIVLTRNRA